MELVRIPTQELDKAWGLVHKDIRQALAYSGQLTDSDFVFETAKICCFRTTKSCNFKQKEI